MMHNPNGISAVTQRHLSRTPNGISAVSLLASEPLTGSISAVTLTASQPWADGSDAVARSLSPVLSGVVFRSCLRQSYTSHTPVAPCGRDWFLVGSSMSTTKRKTTPQTLEARYET
jgi:hypothetical protein